VLHFNEQINNTYMAVSKNPLTSKRCSMQ